MPDRVVLTWAGDPAATQLFQIITVDGDELSFEARTATNRLYDAFTLKKRDGLPNELIETLETDGPGRGRLRDSR